MNNAPPPSEQLTNLLIRVNTLEQKHEQTHTQVQQVQAQLQQYHAESVPSTVNELQLQTIRSGVERTERDMNEMKHDLADVRRELTELNAKFTQQVNDTRESQSKLQIRALWFIVVTVVTVFTGVLIAFLNHLFF